MLRDTFERRTRHMLDAIEAVPEDVIQRVVVEEWAEALAHHYAMDCPRLTGAVSRSKPRDTTIDVSGDRMRDHGFHSERTPHYPAHAVDVYWQFVGDPVIFRLNPQRMLISTTPAAEIRGDELVQEIKWPHDLAAPVDQQADRFKGQVESFLASAVRLVDDYNGCLAVTARSAIDGRLARLRARDDALAMSSIQVREEDAVGSTYISDVLRRRPSPQLPSTRADQKAPALEPVLGDEVFGHILRVLRDALHAMEQSAQSYRAVNEEARRDHLLTVPRLIQADLS
jgi:hypothetical protein